MLKKKIWASFQRIIELFTQKIVTKLSKIWVWDPGSEIQDLEKTYSGYRIQGSKRHRIPDPGSGYATLLYTEENWLIAEEQRRRSTNSRDKKASQETLVQLLEQYLELSAFKEAKSNLIFFLFKRAALKFRKTIGARTGSTDLY